MLDSPVQPAGRSPRRVDIAETWRRIDALLAELSPASAKTLNPPTTLALIAKLEKQLGFLLPIDFKESLLIHDGQTDPRGCWGLTNDGNLLSIAKIYQTWQSTNQVDEDLRDEYAGENDGDYGDHVEWWNPKWIPVAQSAGGDLLCINMDPDLCEVGRIVCFVHDNPFDDTLNWLSFGEWLADLADRLEAGQFEIEQSNSSLKGRLCVLSDWEIE
ncbi:MAG: SMI1/KNR4 family protein [Planctomycetaceae bacterium]